MKKIIIIILLLVILAIILFYPVKKPRPSIESFQVNLDTVADVKAARAAAHHAGYTGVSASIPLTSAHTEPKIVLPTGNSTDNTNSTNNTTNNTTDNSTYNTIDNSTYNTTNNSTDNTTNNSTDNTNNVNPIRF